MGRASNRIRNGHWRKEKQNRAEKTFRRLMTSFIQFQEGKDLESDEVKAKIESTREEWKAYCTKLGDIDLEKADATMLEHINKALATLSQTGIEKAEDGESK